MASSRREPPDFNATPGAAAYLLKKDSASYKHPSPAAFSMGSGRAFQVPVGMHEGPGPGAHECERGMAHPDIRTQHALCLLILTPSMRTLDQRIEVFLCTRL
jgi:hypothetical protein